MPNYIIQTEILHVICSILVQFSITVFSSLIGCQVSPLESTLLTSQRILLRFGRILLLEAQHVL